MMFRQLITGMISRTAIAVLIFSALPTTGSRAQQKPVTISGGRISIREAINRIEVQTGYVIGFRNGDFNASRRVTVPELSGTTKEVLDYLLSGSGQTWEVNGDYIVIMPAPQPTPVVEESAPEAQKPEEVQGITIPTEIMRVTLTPDPEPIPDPRVVRSAELLLSETPHWALKTNLLFDAALTVSLGAEIRLGHKTTLDIPFTHNSWGRINDRQWENFSTQPGIRFWNCEAFNGFFWGAHAHYAKYNFSNLPASFFGASMRDYRYEGHLAGAGIHAGWQWIIGKRWAIEAEAGLGYARLWYEKYACDVCGDRVGAQTQNYFGPTKAAVSLVFMIK